MINLSRFLATFTAALDAGTELEIRYAADEGFTVGLYTAGAMFLTEAHRGPTGALVEAVRFLTNPDNAPVASVMVKPGAPLPVVDSAVSPETRRMLTLASNHARCTFRTPAGDLLTGALLYWPIPTGERNPSDNAADRSGPLAKARVDTGAVVNFRPADLVHVDDPAETPAVAAG